MPSVSNLKKPGLAALAPIVFYSGVGVLFLVMLPFASYPPHIALTGIMNLVTAYGIFTKRSWAKWLVAALFFVATVFSLYTLYFVIANNWVVSISLVSYAIFTWIFTARLLLRD